MKTRARKAAIGAGVVTLVVVLSACSRWWDSESDAIRRTIIAHELDAAGIQVDELIIRLSPSEFRADFGHKTRIVWLVSPPYQRQYREGEYFRVRDPHLSYLFIQDISLDESQGEAQAGVVLYLANGQPTAKELILHKADGDWEVVSETVRQTNQVH